MRECRRRTLKSIYDQPAIYDIIFDAGTEQEADFLEQVHAKHGDCRGRRWLEPACGTGRVMIALARRGCRMVGIDLSEPMLAHARQRARELGIRMSLKQAAMEDFSLRGQFDLAYCLISSFKYLATEAQAVAHLQRMAAHLRPGALYVLGLHLTDYDRDRPVHERWVETVDGTLVICNTRTWPAERRQRRERVRNRLVIKKARGETLRYESSWDFRTYDAAQIRRLVRAVPTLTLVACYDFQHEVTCPRDLDDSQEDIVLVLRKER